MIDNTEVIEGATWYWRHSSTQDAPRGPFRSEEDLLENVKKFLGRVGEPAVTIDIGTAVEALASRYILDASSLITGLQDEANADPDRLDRMRDLTGLEDMVEEAVLASLDRVLREWVDAHLPPVGLVFRERRVGVVLSLNNEKLTEHRNERHRLDGKFHGRIFKNKNGEEVPPDEFVVFLAKDNAFPATLRFYHEECERQGAAPEQLAAVEAAIERLMVWRAEHPERLKTPDVEPGEIQT